MKRNYCMLLVIILLFAIWGCSNKTAQTKQAALKEAHENNLEDQLTYFDKIDEADVSLYLENEESSAIITLTINEIISDAEADKLALLISKSVENLKEENIKITDQDDNIIYPNI